MQARTVHISFAAAILMACLLPAAGKETVLKRKGREAELVESASYSRTSKAYRIKEDGALLTIPAAAVEYCRPPKPIKFDTITDVEGLKEVVREFHRMWWDVEAFKRLMPLYVARGANIEAVRLYRGMEDIVGPGMAVSLRRNYWDALHRSGQGTALQKELEKILAHGSREESAWAYLMRGDVLVEEGKREQALLDGYLKTVILFDDIASCRRQALEKTVQTMTDLGDTRSERFRRLLLSEFPNR